MRSVGGIWRGFSSVLDLIYPMKCPLCGLLADTSPCAVCLEEMPLATEGSSIVDSHHLSFRDSIFRYEGRASQAVRHLKYERATSLVPAMAALLAQRAAAYEGFVAVPVPIHWLRRCRRGFNQAELLASELPYEALLRRDRPTPPQAGLSLSQRQENLVGAFSAHGEVANRSILLIDDVVTSGSTAIECAKVLMEAGAAEVGILALCGTEDDASSLGSRVGSVQESPTNRDNI